MPPLKPLVFDTDGTPREVSAAEVIVANVASVDIYSATNGNAAGITFGQVVYKNSVAGKIDLANAAASGTMRSIGVVYDPTVAANAAGNIQLSGIITYTNTQIAALVDGAPGAGFTPGQLYYLSDLVAGNMSAAVPASGTGHYIAHVGIALSANDLDILPRVIGKRA